MGLMPLSRSADASSQTERLEFNSVRGSPDVKASAVAVSLFLLTFFSSCSLFILVFYSFNRLAPRVSSSPCSIKRPLDAIPERLVCTITFSTRDVRIASMYYRIHWGP